VRNMVGYINPDGSIGIRNYVLIMSVTRATHILTRKISENIRNTKCFIAEDEDGKSSQDRQTMSRVFIGLGSNPNVSAVLVVCNKADSGYPELNPKYIVSKIKLTGKKVELLSVEEAGGYYKALANGIKIARRLVIEASKRKKEKVKLGDLSIGVKCGLSDSTSGISGNPTVGYFLDKLIDDGGIAFFSETTEVIGAEHILAKRFVNDKARDKFLKTVYDTENEAKATGEDIRTINPIPANIEAGLTTLEEKSLGAISKIGSKEIQDVLEYAEKPKGNGLFFVDSWMSSTSLFLGYASSGANLIIFQMGGSALPLDSPMPAIATGLVAPIFYTTGNPITYQKAIDEFDFNSGTIIEERETLEEAGENLTNNIKEIASGMLTKSETLNYQDPIQIYLKGPNL
jgi:altronate dehydratase large subunit